jgi:ribosome biogenesis GTPase YqeH
MQHYNEVSSTVEASSNTFLTMLHRIGAQEGILVHVIDATDAEATWIDGLPRFVGERRILLAVNKVDVLPQRTSRPRLRQWIAMTARQQAWTIADIVLVSARTGEGIDTLYATMQHHVTASRTVFWVGMANVGKSSLVNAVLRTKQQSSKATVTVSAMPGTTLDWVRIPFGDMTFIDTPGVMYRRRVTEVAAKIDVLSLMPQEAIRPRTYQLSAQQTLFFGGYVRADFVQGSRRTWTCYAARTIPIHRTKRARADALMQTQRGILLQPPSASTSSTLPSWSKHTLTILPQKASDVVIAGLGWICLQADDAQATVDVYAPQGVTVFVRPAMIGFGKMPARMEGHRR